MDAAAGSEPSLLARLARGEEAALSEIHAQHGAMVFNACLRLLNDSHDAQDATQAAFLVLWRKAARLRPGTDLGGWLHQAAVWSAREVRRGRKRREARERRAAEMREESHAPSGAEWTAIRGELDEELQRLPSRERSAMVSIYLEGLSRSEAAARLGMPEGTVATLTHRALERLRLRFGRRGKALSVTLLATLLTAHAAEAAAPAHVLSSLLAAAKVSAAGAASAATAGSAGPVLALAEGVSHAMFIAKVQSVAVVLFVLLVAGAATGIAYRALGQEEKAKTGGPGPDTPRLYDDARFAGAEAVVRGVAVAQPSNQSGWPMYTLTVKLVYKDTTPGKAVAGQHVTVKTLAALPPTEATFYLTWDDRQKIYRTAGGTAAPGFSHAQAAGAAQQETADDGPPEATAGVVALRLQLNLVMLSAGMNGLVSVGDSVVLLRGQDEIATGQIKNVYPDMSSAEIVTKKGAPQIGDQARIRLGLLAGVKVLASFNVNPLISLKPPTPNPDAKDVKKARGDLLASIQAGGMDLLRVVTESDPERRGLHGYQAMLLLDCKGRAPAEALKAIRYFAGGIVFQDGVYHEGLPYPGERLKEPFAPNLMAGAKPGDCAYESWGVTPEDLKRKDADMEAYGKIPGLRVEYTPPPAGSGGGAGHVILRPEGKLTLLEVFLRTRAKLQWQQAGAR
jgi:RNA polymerase sigma factor (sigma-70 family)